MSTVFFFLGFFFAFLGVISFINAFIVWRSILRVKRKEKQGKEPPL